MEEQIFEPMYPAELYTKRPNDTAILSPLYDFTFKGIFTQETEESYLALKSFISAVFNRQVSSVVLKSNEPHVETSKQKKMIFDVTVEFEDGELADLEMQTRKQDYDYGERAEILAARLLSNNAKKSKTWESPKVYQISVLNFHYKNNDKKEMRWYTMVDDSGEKLEERLNIIFIDLVTIRRLNKLPVEKLTPLEKWGLFFSYVDDEKKKDYLNGIIQSEKGIMAANNIVKHMSKADSNWFTQNSIYIAERDRNTILANARKRGLEEGRQKGLQEGRQEGLKEGLKEGLAQGAKQNAIESAKKFLQMETVTPEQIAQGTGLTLEEVLALKKEIK